MKYRLEFQDPNGVPVWVQFGTVHATGTWTFDIENIRLEIAPIPVHRVSITWAPDEDQPLTPADRLMEAVRQALASRPQAFPTVSDYVAAVNAADPKDVPRLARDIEGWELAAAEGVQRVAILTDKMGKIASDGGLDDPGLGLRGLKARGILIPGGETDGRLARRQRVGRQTPRVYELRMPVGK